VETKNKRGGSKIANRDFLPKSKPKVTQGDVAKKVGKIVYQSSFQAPSKILKGLLTRDMEPVKEAFAITDALKKQKESGNLPKVGQIKNNKVQQNLKMVKPSKYYNKGGYVITGRK